MPSELNWQRGMESRRAAMAVAFGMWLVVAVSACRPAAETPRLDRRQLVSFSQLQGARASSHAPLRLEMERLSSESGLPNRIIRQAPRGNLNLAQALEQAFESAIVAEHTRAAEKYLRLTLSGDPESPLPALDAYNRRMAGKRLAVRQALSRPECDFGVDYRLGFFVDTSFVDSVALDVHLEGLEAMAQLSGGKPESAASAVCAMFELTERLAEVPLVESRVRAAGLRAEACRVLERCVADPLLRRWELERLADQMEATLRNWPDEREVWKGDRAQTVHAYEVARAGHLNAILTREEITALRNEDLLGEMRRTLPQRIDADQAYYLKTMRRWIALCQKPYYQRRAELEEFRRDWQLMRQSGRFPVMAVRLFLSDVERAMSEIAADRARVEIWSIALARALHRPRPEYDTSPLTGVAYAERSGAGRVTVLAGTRSDLAATVPLPIGGTDDGDSHEATADPATIQEGPLGQADRGTADERSDSIQGSAESTSSSRSTTTQRTQARSITPFSSRSENRR
jgi:hypothetical protein